jgi:hypothetical protein
VCHAAVSSITSPDRPRAQRPCTALPAWLSASAHTYVRQPLPEKQPRRRGFLRWLGQASTYARALAEHGNFCSQWIDRCGLGKCDMD